MKLQNSKQRADVKSNQKKRPTYKGMMRILTSGFSKTTENSSHWNKTTIPSSDCVYSNVGIPDWRCSLDR